MIRGAAFSVGRATRLIRITLENCVIGWQRQAIACRWLGPSAIGKAFGLAAATRMPRYEKLSGNRYETHAGLVRVQHAVAKKNLDVRLGM